MSRLRKVLHQFYMINTVVLRLVTSLLAFINNFPKASVFCFFLKASIYVCSFIKFATESDALCAVRYMNNHQLGDSKILVISKSFTFIQLYLFLSMDLI